MAVELAAEQEVLTEATMAAAREAVAREAALKVMEVARKAAVAV